MSSKFKILVALSLIVLIALGRLRAGALNPGCARGRPDAVAASPADR